VLNASIQQVLTHVIAGRMNKQIAAELGTGEKNVRSPDLRESVLIPSMA
jgi:FixJ family two-component response regulator